MEQVVWREWMEAARHDRATVSIIPRQIVKAMTETARHKFWQATTPARD